MIGLFAAACLMSFAGGIFLISFGFAFETRRHHPMNSAMVIAGTVCMMLPAVLASVKGII